MATLRDTVPEIIAGSVILTIGAVISILEPEWQLLVWSSVLALELIALAGSRVVRRAWRAKRLRAKEAEYLESVVGRYQMWKERYLQLGVEVESSTGPVWDDITIHPAMYMLLEGEPESGSGEGRSSTQHLESKVKVHLPDVLEGHHQVVLLGEPGCGKSTQLQWLALELGRVASCSRRGARSLPVLIELSRYTTDESVEQFVGRSLREDHGRGGEFLAQHLRDYLEKGTLVVLFDGLNQMPADGYRERTDRLRRFARTWHRNKFLFSCRVLDYEYRFGWPRVVIAPLDEPQVEEFVRRYLPTTGSQLMQQLWTGDRALLDLARNAFILRMIILVHERSGTLPASRARLLNDFVDCLVAREKKDDLWPHTSEAAAFKDALAQLAFVMIESGKLGATVERDWVESALAGAPSAEEYASSFTMAEMLKLGADANLLEITRGQDRVRYYHELLQEYFAALLLERRHARGEEPLFLFGDSRWEPTAALLCGLVREPDPLVLSILHGLGPERGALLAGACCAEARGVLLRDTVDQVVGSLQALAGGVIGPLGIRAMDLIARIDYARIEDMVFEPPPEVAEPADQQTALLLGAKYTRIVPIYMGPFSWATRDRAWEPRAYAASLVRTMGSKRIGEMLVRLLDSPRQSPDVEVMVSGVLADMRYSAAAGAFIRTFAEGSRTGRIHAARGLGRIAAGEARPLLTKALLDPAEGPDVRGACAFALGEIGGAELVESLARGSSDSELQEIAHRVVSELQPPTGQLESSWPDDTQVEIDALREVEPTELLGRLVAAYDKWGTNTYPLAAALALQSDEAFIPQLEAAIQRLHQPVVYYYPHGEYKLREALWWTIDAIRERQRRGGRPPRLTASPRDWSAFGAPAR